MVTIKQHKYLVVKRKRCSLYRKKCVSKKDVKLLRQKHSGKEKKNYNKKAQKMFSKIIFKKI